MNEPEVVPVDPNRPAPINDMDAIAEQAAQELGQEKSLASVPLSSLMANEMVCPLCGQPLPTDTKETIIDGERYQVCKKCYFKK